MSKKDKKKYTSDKKRKHWRKSSEEDFIIPLINRSGMINIACELSVPTQEMCACKNISDMHLLMLWSMLLRLCG